MSRSRGPFVALALALAPACAVAQAEATTIVTRITTSSESAAGSSRTVDSTRTVANLSAARTEFLDSVAHPLVPAGGSTLSIDGKSYVLDHAKKEYYVIDLAKMAEDVKAVQQRTGMTMTYAAPEVTVEHLGAGEVLLGETTDRWKTTMRTTISMSMSGMDGMSMQTESITEYWYGRTIAPSGMSLPSRTSAGTPAGAGLIPPEMRSKIAEMTRQLPVAIPLRTVTSVSVTNPMMSQRTTTTSEIVSISHDAVPAASFALPAGYREVPMPRMPGM